MIIHDKHTNIQFKIHVSLSIHVFSNVVLSTFDVCWVSDLYEYLISHSKS